MTSSATKTLCIFILSGWLVLISLAPPSQVDARMTVYEVLQKYNFPEGIIPKNVKDYDLDENTGHFNVYLDSACGFKLDKYKINYESQISGYITSNNIEKLDGVWAKKGIFKLKINKVIRDGDELKFYSGWISAHVAADHIPGIPQCGCGFYCGAASHYSFNPSPVPAPAAAESISMALH